MLRLHRLRVCSIMLLTVSKRIEFSSSRRLFVPTWSEAQNEAAFGPETHARYGTGRNYIAYFIFSGRVDPITGMLINISEIKERAGRVVDDRFDHKFLNEDNPQFGETPPTVENIARQLYIEVGPLFADVDAKLVACHLVESPERTATFYSSGASDSNYWFTFSAARRTMSPHLSAAENERLFGSATGIHGHNYRTRLTFRSEQPKDTPLVKHQEITDCIQSLRQELDHKYLNDVPSLKEQPLTTEAVAIYIRDRIASGLPIHRVRLHERDDFFAEAWKDDRMFLGMQMPFSAAHRLHIREFSDAKNVALFGKCDNARGHGHLYMAEATVTGDYDRRSGVLFNFVPFNHALAESLEPWRDRHLDQETEDFKGQPSTGENIVGALWPKVDERVNHQLIRLRLWETPNNRFTLRQN
jgi:6-pyruvoyltetrahydropterin/6-carboxytetrahydropterin synthase